jgi:hypothetical protein
MPAASWKYAASTLYFEVMKFRFDYPLRIVPEAGPRDSLNYYLYSDSLSWKAMRMDSNGIPREWERITGTVYRPDYIACYGLTNLGHYLRSGNQQHLDIFLKQLGWLEKHATIRADGAAVWTNDFDYREGPVFLKAPWLSANTTGFVISALVRGWRVTREPRLLDLLRRSSAIFELDYDRQGIRVPVDSYFLYTEKPGVPAPGIMDGFLRSLLGLYDLAIELEDPAVEGLFNQGIAGLKHVLPLWDFKNRWSWYGNRAYLCPPNYHCLNRLLLLVLARIAREPMFAKFAENWDPAKLSLLQRGEIYLQFLRTKNRSRIANRTWRHGQNVSHVMPFANKSLASNPAACETDPELS